MKSSLVVMDNDLIRASYRLTVNEIRLVLCALAQIPKDEPIDPKQAYYISKEDFVKLGVNPKTVAREIREGCNDLLSRTVTIDTPLGDLGVHWVHSAMHFKSEVIERLKKEYPNVRSDNEFINKLRLHNLIDSIPIIVKSDDNIVARIIFHEDIIPYISELKEQFTKLNLHDLFAFSSFYSFRFYLMMMQFKETGYIKIPINDLRKALGLEKKYKATRDLKLWVIDTAVDEINEKSPYKLSYDFIQKGRTYTHLELRFKLKQTIKKTKEIQNRDIDTIDMFHHMTDAQVAKFSSKLSQLSEFSFLAQGNESYEVLAIRIASMLKDQEQQKVFTKALKKLGFKP